MFDTVKDVKEKAQLLKGLGYEITFDFENVMYEATCLEIKKVRETNNSAIEGTIPTLEMLIRTGCLRIWKGYEDKEQAKQLIESLLK